MGNPLFGVNISGLIKEYVRTGVLDASLIKFTSGTRTVGQLTGGTNPTSTTYACKGFIDTQAKTDITGTLVADDGVTIVLIGDTINGGATDVDSGDQITIEGRTYIVGVVDRDPAAATYTCQSKAI